MSEKRYDVAPTEEFKRIKEKPHNEFMPYLNRWHMMIKSVLNDYYFDTHDEEWLEDLMEVDHFMHKLYFCWQEMGNALYGDEEE